MGDHSLVLVFVKQGRIPSGCEALKEQSVKWRVHSSVMSHKVQVHYSTHNNCSGRKTTTADLRAKELAKPRLGSGSIGRRDVPCGHTS